jgi:hypothetical protein
MLQEFAEELSELISYSKTLETANTSLWERITALESRPSSYQPSGQVPFLGPLPLFRSVGWAEDFDTDVALGAFPGPYLTRLNVYGPPHFPGYYDTSRNPYYNRPVGQWGEYRADRTASVDQGVLRIRMHTEGIRPMVFNLLPSFGEKIGNWYYQLYGAYEICARFPSAMPGYKIAWLLWPSSNDGRGDGEIDMPETDLASLTSVGGFVHRIDGTSGGDQHVMAKYALDMRQWHRYRIEWAPNSVRFYIDDVETGEWTERIPNTPMRWAIQCETTLTQAAPDPKVQGDILIDWMTIREYVAS